MHEDPHECVIRGALFADGLGGEPCLADINIIDFDKQALRKPCVVDDLPGGGIRLLQRAEGYVATIVSGQVIQRDGQATGKLPRKLVRSPR